MTLFIHSESPLHASIQSNPKEGLGRKAEACFTSSCMMKQTLQDCPWSFLTLWLCFFRALKDSPKMCSLENNINNPITISIIQQSYY